MFHRNRGSPDLELHSEHLFINRASLSVTNPGTEGLAPTRMLCDRHPAITEKLNEEWYFEMYPT